MKTQNSGFGIREIIWWPVQLFLWTYWTFYIPEQEHLVGRHLAISTSLSTGNFNSFKSTLSHSQTVGSTPFSQTLVNFDWIFADILSKTRLTFFKIRLGRVGRGCSEPSGQIQVLGIQDGSGAFKTSTLSEIGVHPDLYNHTE